MFFLSGLMESAQAERRRDERFPLHVLVVLRSMQGGVLEESSLTQNVSAGGAFFYVKRKLPLGTPVEFILSLPEEITLAESIHVRCKGKVVRVVDGVKGDETGVAVIIGRYEFLANTPKKFLF